jgi:beta-galactosidase GanA
VKSSGLLNLIGDLGILQGLKPSKLKIRVPLFIRSMRRPELLLISLFGAYFLITTACKAQESVGEIPSLVRDGDRTDLLVNGSPFIILGGQAQNSSASTIDDIEVVYRALNAIHANTAEIPLSWNLIEDQPGHFDFHLIDGAIEGARRHHLKLIFLWFGSEKNATLSYVPIWIKTGRKTYFRARDERGEEIKAISPFCQELLKAETLAFSSVMRHVREVDEHDNTVIMVQVENETGLMHTDRDYSEPADQAFSSGTPSDLLKYLEEHRENLMPAMAEAWKQSGYRKSGTWSEVFGDLAPEVFSAWSISRYVDRIAEAGKAEYPLPFYVNVSLMNSGAARAGDWPSGGPTEHILDVWKAIAKHIDLVEPDIYRVDFPTAAVSYRRSDNVLFVPETLFAPYYAPYVFTVIAGMDGIGFSPFGVDLGHLDGQLTSAESAFEENYRVLQPLLPLIIQNRCRGTLFPIVLNMYRHDSVAIPLGDSLAAVVHFDETFVADIAAHRGGGIIIKLAPTKFIVAGEGFHLDFEELKGIPRNAGYLSIEEGTFQGERWVTKQVLNGDEENTILPPHHPRILLVQLERESN